MKKLLCPLRREDMTGMGDCVQEKCGWWIEEELYQDGKEEGPDSACAIRRIAEKLK